MFAGIGGFRLGVRDLDYECIWANDVAKLACDVYEDKFGKGSVIHADVHDVIDSVPEHNLLTAGFPCQPFSQAGKKLGTSELRGTLFECIAQVLQNRHPQFFILENVKRLLSMEGGTHFKVILSELCRDGYWVEWRLLNAKHFGLAQNRERVIIVGVADVNDGRFLDAIQTHSVLLTDDDVGELKLSGTEALSEALRPLEEFNSKFHNWGLAHEGRVLTRSVPEMSYQVSPVLLRQILQPNTDPSFDLTERTLTWIHENTEVNEFINGVEILSNQDGGRRMGYTIFGIRGLAPTVTATTSRHYERYLIDARYRRLTNVEYARLQGFPDDWCRIATVYDQYSLYGNAVPPPMIRWVASRLSGNNVGRDLLQPDTLFAF
jgi:DNA (cytosine-5)-methyltransferase 1